MSLLPNNTGLRLLGSWHRARQALARRLGNARRLKEARGQFYQTAWRQAAESIGAEVADLGDGLMEIVAGPQTARLWNNYTPLDDPVTLRYAGNKPAVLNRLAQLQIPTPAWTTFTLADLTPAATFLAGRTCVVKPARYTGAGSGVTTGVRTAGQLRKAAALASAFDSLLLIEEQIAGDNYRLLFLDGALLETVRRRPPTLRGDGRNTLKQLLALENQQRLAEGWRRAQALLTIDADLKQTLSAAGLSLQSRLAMDQRAAVKTVINENRAAENEPVDRLAAETIAQCRQAADALGVRLAGVDIVTTDAQRPLAAAGGVVLEINTTPGLYHHYDPQRNECRVALPILSAALMETGRRAELRSQVMEHSN